MPGGARVAWQVSFGDFPPPSWVAWAKKLIESWGPPLPLNLPSFQVQQGQQQNKFKGPVDIAKCTECVHSNFFWSYIKMVNVLAEIGNHLYSWLQACPCHRGGARVELNKSFGQCPMAGRLLPQLAAGDLERFAGDLFTTSQVEILRLTHGLQGNTVTRVLQDFEFGRQHMLAHIRVKGAYHADLPLLLAGLAHPDAEVARRLARGAVAAWAVMEPHERTAAHFVTKRFLSEDEAGVVTLRYSQASAASGRAGGSASVCAGGSVVVVGGWRCACGGDGRTAGGRV